MRRAIIGILAAGGVAAAVFAMAASLTVNSDNLGAGSDNVASCDTDGVTVSYTVTFDEAFEVETVTVAGINLAACTGQTLFVTLVDSDATTATANVVVATASHTLELDQPLEAEKIDEAHVAITGVEPTP